MSGYKPPSGSGGATDHSALSNLDYASSGHTGFVPDQHDDDNQVPFYSGGWSVIDVSNFALTFLDDADASAVRTTLGLAIGTNVQAYDEELAAIAGLTSASNKGIYFTGSGTAATYDLSPFARTFLDDADGATVCATLGAEKTSNKNNASGYAGLTSESAINVQNRILHFSKVKTAWSTGVAFTVTTGVTANGDYMFNVPYWLERVTGGATRKSATWRHLLRRTGGTLSILNNGEVGSLGGFAPTQAWAVSGDNITWTITSAGSDGYVSYFRELMDCSDMTVA